MLFCGTASRDQREIRNVQLSLELSTIQLIIRIVAC